MSGQVSSTFAAADAQLQRQRQLHRPGYLNYRSEKAILPAQARSRADAVLTSPGSPFASSLSCVECSMMIISPAPVRRVLAPDGSVLTLADLPPPDAQRWVASRKAIVVAAVRGGLLSMSDACARYRLTTEEFLNWQTQVDRDGLQGLRTTRIQEYRGTGP